MMNYLMIILLGVWSTAIADDKGVYFISPQHEAVLTSPVTIKFGLRGMGVAPAGVKLPNTGHHHLIIDGVLPPLDRPIPADENHLHFGKGQTETTLNLDTGTHTLQLLLGNHSHIPHQPPIYSQPITITITN